MIRRQDLELDDLDGGCLFWFVALIGLAVLMAISGLILFFAIRG